MILPQLTQLHKAADVIDCNIREAECFCLGHLTVADKIRYTIVSSRRWLVNMDSLAQFFEQGAAPAEQPAAVVNGIRRIAP